VVVAEALETIVELERTEPCDIALWQIIFFLALICFPTWVHKGVNYRATKTGERREGEAA
jgi:hypothetical protein